MRIPIVQIIVNELEHRESVLRFNFQKKNNKINKYQCVTDDSCMVRVLQII